MSEATQSLLVLLVVVGLFIWNRLPGEVVSVGAALLLYAIGLVDVEQAFSGFGDPVIVFIASLFVVSEAIDSTGVTAWAGQKVVSLVGDDRRRLLALLMVVSALSAALISPNGAVAALLPMAVALAIRTHQSPARLAMPLAFSATAGSLLVLTGTPVNLLVSNAASQAGASGFGFFEFALVGVPCVAGTIGIVLALGPRALADRRGSGHARDLSAHARTLIEQYRLEGGIYRLRVRARSPLVGRTRSKLEVSDAGVELVALESGGSVSTDPDAKLGAGDVLVVHGASERVSDFVVDQALSVTLAQRPGERPETLLSRELGAVEIVIPPRSRYVGSLAFPGMRVQQDLVVLGVQRRGRQLGVHKTHLLVGDSLLLQGTWEALQRASDANDVLVVDAPDLVRRQALPMGPGAKRAIAVLVAMILLLALDVVPSAIATVLAAFALVIMRVVGLEQAYRAISWTTVLLVAGLFPLSEVLQETGAANSMAYALVSLTSGQGPLAVLAGFFLLVGALCQFLGTMATALIVIPVALSAARELDASPRPFLMALTVATAGAFLTPIATSVNMMVTGPGGYRFGDFWKLGLPIVLWFLVVAIGLVPWIWPL